MTRVNDGLNLNVAWESVENNLNKNNNAVLILNSTTNRTALQCSKGITKLSHIYK